MSNISTTRTFQLTLIGNPNAGKSSVFNRLTGLQQRVGNFPGVTVDLKKGTVNIPNGPAISVTDFPGAYSLYPNTRDERMVVQTLANPEDPNYPDTILYIADYTRLEKHLLLFSQLTSLGIPLILGINMADLADKSGRIIDREKLAQSLGTPVILLSSHQNQGFEELQEVLRLAATEGLPLPQPIASPTIAQHKKLTEELTTIFPSANDYQRLLIAHHVTWLPQLNETTRNQVKQLAAQHQFQSINEQVNETMARYDHFEPIVKKAIKQPDLEDESLTTHIDRIITHRFWGPLIFFGLMFLVFQAIYAWAEFPMNAIDELFASFNSGVKAALPAGWFNDLLTDGIISGLGGVVIFIPQIAILFFLITLLEEVGYMARAAYMFDSVMHFFGLNGRSLVALISSGACAIPAVMSTRTIANWKERLITIMVAPFISCSARLPVYVVLIGFVVPPDPNGGIINRQGLAFMGLYLLGVVAALGTALVMKLIVSTQERSTLLLELPNYRRPLLRNVGLTVWEKVRAFIVEAGRVILVISIILWALSSYGPAEKMTAAEAQARQEARTQQLDETVTDDLIAAYKMEASYAGIMGKQIEPVIAPLGFDWKMGVAIICSFAAREVFVGTMATLYSVGSEVDNETGIIERLRRERDPVTGEQLYTPARAASLLIFYVFAMMCMSTLAVVKRETDSWKWPVIQFVFMTGLAYIASWVTYQLMS